MTKQAPLVGACLATSLGEKQMHNMPKGYSVKDYIQDMRNEAVKHRELAASAYDDEGLKKWLLNRALKYDQRADDATEE